MKKSSKIFDLLKEDVGYTPEKAREIIEKNKKDYHGYKDQADRLFNIFSNIALGDILVKGGNEQVKKIERTCEILEEKLRKIQNLLEDDISYDMEEAGEKELSEEASKLGNHYNHLNKHIDAIQSAASKIVDVIDDLEDNYDQLEHLNKYKK